MTLAWSLFTHPMTLSSDMVMWLVLPLALSVAVIYKAIRVRRVAELPRQVAILMVQMVGGLIALGLVLWAVATYWP
ncbi:MAG: hypothetical protein ACOCZU_08595 [Planctomycetota bacterium]